MRRRLSAIAKAAVFLRHQMMFPKCIAEMIASRYCYCRLFLERSDPNGDLDAPPRGDFCIIHTKDVEQGFATGDFRSLEHVL